MIDPGLEPRAPLRYRAAKGTTTTLQVGADITIEMSGQKMPWAAVRTTSEVSVDDVQGDGAMHVRYAIKSATAEDRPGAAISAAQMTTPLQDIVGTQIVGTLSGTGQLSGLVVDTGGKQLPPALAGQVQVLTRALERMIMPLPDAPVGATALWTFEQPLDQTGMKLTAKSQIRVTAVTTDTATIVLMSGLSGPDQDTSAAGPKVKLSEIRGTMRGKGVIDFAHISFNGELVAELHMKMTSDGETEATAMTTTLTIGPAPATAPPSP